MSSKRMPLELVHCIMRNTPPGLSETKMNPRIWGQLQHHIDLKTIYAKLPFREFFQMRLVCKEWNRLASDREFLEESFKDPIPKPYFILSRHGLLAYEASSSRWNCTPLPPRLPYSHLEITGLLYSYNYNWKCESFEQEVFNVHTRVSYKLPQALECTVSPVVSMVVDTSVSPYSFQIILGSDEYHTQIFDLKSNSWTKRRSVQSCLYGTNATTCAHVNGFVYIRSEMEALADMNDLDCYDLEKDEWGKVEPAEMAEYDYIHEIGSWQGSLFDVTMDSGIGKITVWKLTEHPEEDVKWMVYDRIPEDLLSWLTHGLDLGYSMKPQVDNKFCREYLLVYTLQENREAQRFVMCNLATKAWERIQVPFDDLDLSKS